MDRYDAIRAQHPDLILNLYGFTPRGPVTLEVIAPDGFRREWVGETAETVYDLAFPAEPTPDDLEIVEQEVKALLDTAPTLSGHPLGSDADMEFHRSTGSQIPKQIDPAAAPDLFE